MKILVINSGSSSIKYELFKMPETTSIATGVVERIGESKSGVKHVIRATDTEEQFEQEVAVADHAQGLAQIAEALRTHGLVKSGQDLHAVGHRVAHGGEKFRGPTRLNEEVLAEIEQLCSLAPLHNPANLLGIRQTMQAFPGVPQVAVFDTAFHQTVPRHAYLYALPFKYYQTYGIRRYGFHGTSHQFVSRMAADHLRRPLDSLKLITVHLGNGASMAAIDRGRSVDTSMGLTPLEGLMMGTRSGDLDPAILPFLAQKEGLSCDALEQLLNQDSGLKGICGANDMREILRLAEQSDAMAKLAIQMYAYRIKKYLGAYLAVLGGADAIVFTAGIGENVPPVRAAACEGLVELGVKLDAGKNSNVGRGVYPIHASDSRVSVLVVQTDEELEIAMQTRECLPG